MVHVFFCCFFPKELFGNHFRTLSNVQSRLQKFPAKTKLCLVEDHVIGWPAKANFKLLAD